MLYGEGGAARYARGMVLCRFGLPCSGILRMKTNNSITPFLSFRADVRGAVLLAAVGGLGFFLTPRPVADIGEALLLCIALFS